MITYIFILVTFALGLYLMRQQGRYEAERSSLLGEIKLLFESLKREIGVLGRSPELLSHEGELPVLASYGFFSLLRESGDFGATLAASLPRLPLPTRATALLSEYAESFGLADREGEERALSHLLDTLSPMLSEEIGDSRTRVRTFRIVTVSLLLSVAILLI